MDCSYDKVWSRYKVSTRWDTRQKMRKQERKEEDHYLILSGAPSQQRCTWLPSAARDCLLRSIRPGIMTISNLNFCSDHSQFPDRILLHCFLFRDKMCGEKSVSWWKACHSTTFVLYFCLSSHFYVGSLFWSLSDFRMVHCWQ